MEKFERLSGIAAPIPFSNIDTGMLAHSQWLRDHYDDPAGGLFRDWRFDAAGAEVPDFILNREPFRQSRIIVAGPNFGCGSSRETAVWALMKFGIRCVIAPSFGDIFRDNCFQNGLLPITLEHAVVDRMIEALQRSNDPTISVDLVAGSIEVPTIGMISFDVAADRRAMLRDGLDETLLIKRSETSIAGFETQDRRERPWIYTRSA